MKKTWFPKVFDYLNITANIKYVIFLAIIIIVTRQVFTYLKLILSVKIQQEIAKRLRESFFEHLIETDLKYIKSFKTGANANLITTEIHNTAIAGVAPFNIVTAILLLLSYLGLESVQLRYFKKSFQSYHILEDWFFNQISLS